VRLEPLSSFTKMGCAFLISMAIMQLFLGFCLTFTSLFIGVNGRRLRKSLNR
jgi:hypothetical protein